MVVDLPVVLGGEVEGAGLGARQLHRQSLARPGRGIEIVDAMGRGITRYPDPRIGLEFRFEGTEIGSSVEGPHLTALIDQRRVADRASPIEEGTAQFGRDGLGRAAIVSQHADLGIARREVIAHRDERADVVDRSRIIQSHDRIRKADAVATVDPAGDFPDPSPA